MADHEIKRTRTGRDKAPGGKIAGQEPSRSVRVDEPINFVCIRVAERETMCTECALPDCVGFESEQCPVRIEERRRLREKYQQRNQGCPKRHYTRGEKNGQRNQGCPKRRYTRRSQGMKNPFYFAYIRCAEREAMCANCPLPRCVGLESEECPVRVENRRRQQEKRDARLFHSNGSQTRMKRIRYNITVVDGETMADSKTVLISSSSVEKALSRFAIKHYSVWNANLFVRPVDANTYTLHRVWRGTISRKYFAKVKITPT